MNDNQDYIDELGRKHWVATLRCDYIGDLYDRFINTSDATKTCWISKCSLQFYQTIAVDECVIIDFHPMHTGVCIEYGPHYVTNIILFTHLCQKICEWVPHIYPDLGWIIAEYAFDLRHVPRAARSSCGAI
jgi:hypothetical protein